MLPLTLQNLKYLNEGNKHRAAEIVTVIAETPLPDYVWACMSC